MQATDYETTGKTYKKLDAYTKGNCSQQMPDPESWYYFGSTIQFKTCKNFKAFLESKFVGHKFTVEIAKR